MDFDAFQNKLPRSRPDGHLLALAMPILMAAALSWWLVSSSAPQTVDGRKPSPPESTVDASITPGDDFFGYANGGLLKTTPIPAWKGRWGAPAELEAHARQRIAAHLH